ncbi:hypothetical protein BXY51_008686 [Actinoplanes cyaneus]|nr:hypothetical protein [Actinoplanes cyaneus]
MVAALLLTQQACSSTTPDAAAPASATAHAPAADVTSARPTTPDKPAEPDTGDSAPSPRAPSATPVRSATGSSGDVLGGTRQVVIRPLPSSGSVVAVDGNGRLTTTDGDGGALFVLTPTGGQHLIRTATARAGGEASCMKLTPNGSNPLTIRAAACDAGDSGQLFSIRKQRAKDAAGRSTYTISSGGAYLQVSAQNGLIAEELGDGSTRTTFSFVDNGKATLPQLGD